MFWTIFNYYFFFSCGDSTEPAAEHDDVRGPSEATMTDPDGPTGQQTKLLDQSPMGPFQGQPISVPNLSSPVRSFSRQILQSPSIAPTPERRLERQTSVPHGPSGDDNANVVPQNLSSPARSSVSRRILQSPNVGKTPERRLSREEQLRTPERTRSRKYLYDLDNVPDELYDLDNVRDELYDLNNVPVWKY